MEIKHCKYSLFLLETEFAGFSDVKSECFKYIETFETLKEAQDYQSDMMNKTIIIPTY